MGFYDCDESVKYMYTDIYIYIYMEGVQNARRERERECVRVEARAGRH